MSRGLAKFLGSGADGRSLHLLQNEVNATNVAGCPRLASMFRTRTWDH